MLNKIYPAEHILLFLSLFAMTGKGNTHTSFQSTMVAVSIDFLHLPQVMSASIPSVSGGIRKELPRKPNPITKYPKRYSY